MPIDLELSHPFVLINNHVQYIGSLVLSFTALISDVTQQISDHYRFPIRPELSRPFILDVIIHRESSRFPSLTSNK